MLHLARTTFGRLRPFLKGKVAVPFMSIGFTNALDISNVSKFILPDMIDKYKSFSPNFDKELTKLLKGMARATAQDLDNGVRGIRLGDGARIGSDIMAGGTLYERSFYPQLVSAIRTARRRVCLISNPGTAKSTFQFYLLARYVKPSLFNDAPLSGPVRFGSDCPPEVVIRHIPKQGVEIWFLEQQVVHRVSKTSELREIFYCFDCTKVQYFFEPGESTLVEPFRFETLSLSTLATVSPRETRYHEFSKYATTLYMPVFKSEELVTIGLDMKKQPDFDHTLDDEYTEEKIRGRYADHNGIIRPVLPENIADVDYSKRKQNIAIDSADPMAFLTNRIDRTSGISHHLAVFNVPVDDKGRYDFSKYWPVPVSDEVVEKVKEKFLKVHLADRIGELCRYSETKINKFGTVGGIFETAIHDHLTGIKGLGCTQRGSEGTTAPLRLKLRAQRVGKIPKFADMEAGILYKSFKVNFSFCNFVYKDEQNGGLVCVQVSIEEDGQRSVTKSSFERFCKHIGWEEGESPEDLCDIISFVYCPLPCLADKAKVIFEDGIGLSKYTVWRISRDFQCGA